VAGEDREIHVSGLAGRRALPVEEVRVPIDEPKPAALRHRKEDAEQERAIAAQHELTFASLQHRAHTRGDRRRGPADVPRSNHARVGVASRVADAGGNRSRIARAQALKQAGVAERGGCALLAPAPA